MTELAMIQTSWDQAAREDAMFNILTHPDRRDGGWTPEEFFATGREEIITAMVRVLPPVADAVPVGRRVKHDRALDFGCGVGRATQALTMWFERVDGVDISEEMVERARVFSASLQPQAWAQGRVAFHHNPAGNLALFEDDTFDLVYTMVVLQHMPQDLQRGYVSEFFRVLKPGGVAMFHTPEGPDSGHPGWHLSMHGVQRSTVEEWIAEAGGALVDVEDLGLDSGWRNLRYTAVAS